MFGERRAKECAEQLPPKALRGRWGSKGETEKVPAQGFTGRVAEGVCRRCWFFFCCAREAARQTASAECGP